MDYLIGIDQQRFKEIQEEEKKEIKLLYGPFDDNSEYESSEHSFDTTSS